MVAARPIFRVTLNLTFPRFHRHLYKEEFDEIWRAA
jgi:hypothetical protein